MRLPGEYPHKSANGDCADWRGGGPNRARTDRWTDGGVIHGRVRVNFAGSTCFANRHPRSITNIDEKITLDHLTVTARLGFGRGRSASWRVGFCPVSFLAGRGFGAWLSGRLAFWLSGFLAAWPPGRLAFWLSGFLAFWPGSLWPVGICSVCSLAPRAFRPGGFWPVASDWLASCPAGPLLLLRKLSAP